MRAPLWRDRSHLSTGLSRLFTGETVRRPTPARTRPPLRPLRPPRESGKRSVALAFRSPPHDRCRSSARHRESRTPSHPPAGGAASSRACRVGRAGGPGLPLRAAHGRGGARQSAPGDPRDLRDAQRAGAARGAQRRLPRAAAAGRTALDRRTRRRGRGASGRVGGDASAGAGRADRPRPRQTDSRARSGHRPAQRRGDHALGGGARGRCAARASP